mmetsp:Transcript_3880/g.11795  ORF Transcript_3880/g.11795 Transcript_3880/m.11795 type:complete len:206 (+) Transcript_3880:96-713(+)
MQPMANGRAMENVKIWVKTRVSASRIPLLGRWMSTAPELGTTNSPVPPPLPPPRPRSAQWAAAALLDGALGAQVLRDRLVCVRIARATLRVFGDPQSCLALVVLGIELRPRLDEGRHTLHAADAGGQHQSRDPMLCFGVHVCTGLDEGLHVLHIAVNRGVHQSRLPLFVFGIQICTGLDEGLHGLQLGAAAGHHQRGLPIAVCAI